MSGGSADHPGSPALHGADAAVVRRAIADRDPLPGSGGFAGVLDGRLVRDVLGRYPLFVDVDRWAFAPDDLADPDPVPAGTVRSLDGAGGATGDPHWRLPDPDPVADHGAAVAGLRDALDATLADLPPETPVAFSGGVDSALVASATDGPLYVVGFPDSHDVAAARDAADAMGRREDLRVVELTPERLERAVPAVAGASGRTDAMAVAIALPLFLVARRAAADGHDRLAVGQGADELFGGYDKVARAPEDPRTAADTVAGARRELLATLPDQLERDVLTLRGAGVEPVAPLLHDRVVAAALGLPGDLLVDDRGERKVALRRAARGRVPDRVAFREKKAVQYGSLVSRELDRLARQAGFKSRMEDHVGQYVRSRLG